MVMQVPGVGVVMQVPGVGVIMQVPGVGVVMHFTCRRDIQQLGERGSEECVLPSSLSPCHQPGEPQIQNDCRNQWSSQFILSEISG